MMRRLWEGGIHDLVAAWYGSQIVQFLYHQPTLSTCGCGSGVNRADEEHWGSISGPLAFLGSYFTY